MPTWGTVLSPDQIEDLVALMAAWRDGEQIQPDFSVTELLDSALYALGQDDPQSAAMFIERALTATTGAAQEILHNAAAQLTNGDTDGAQATLEALQAQWPLGDAPTGALVYSTYCAACHGAQGEGGIGLALRDNPNIQAQTNAELHTLVVDGRPGTAMAGFAGRLDETQIADLIAFLRLWQINP
jgi:mono/diheme cytochrome c family protein